MAGTGGAFSRRFYEGGEKDALAADADSQRPQGAAAAAIERRQLLFGAPPGYGAEGFGKLKDEAARHPIERRRKRPGERRQALGNGALEPCRQAVAQPIALIRPQKLARQGFDTWPQRVRAGDQPRHLLPAPKDESLG
jgi:hypothetical protein